MFEQLFDALAKAALDSAINSVNVASACRAGKLTGSCSKIP